MLLELLLLCASANAAPAAPLPALKVSEVTVSGVSSGAFMAVQMEVAFSKTIRGSASVAGGIYWCAEGDSRRAQSTCMGKPGEIDAKAQIAKARELAAQGQIDPLENLAGHRNYVFASPKDTIIFPANSEKLLEFYGALGAKNIRLEESVEAAHGFPTLSSGGACDKPGSPWILKCGYDGAGEILRTFYPNLAPKGAANEAHLRKFSQADYGNAQTPLFPEGWIYVPAACAEGASCRLHVALHGCLMNPDFIQDQFPRLAGYNEWAETNKIVVLYPQSAKLGEANPFACWDWFGFTGQNYVTQSGAQMSALRKMIDRVGGR